VGLVLRLEHRRGSVTPNWCLGWYSSTRSRPSSGPRAFAPKTPGLPRIPLIDCGGRGRSSVASLPARFFLADFQDWDGCSTIQDRGCRPPFQWSRTFSRDPLDRNRPARGFAHPGHPPEFHTLGCTSEDTLPLLADFLEIR